MKRHEKLWILLAVVFVAAAVPAFAAAPPDLLTEPDIKEKIGKIIKLISGILGIVVVAIGFLIGGVKSLNGAEDAMKWIKGGTIGGFLCFSAWGLAKLFMSTAGFN